MLKHWVEDLPLDKRNLLLIDNFKGHTDREIVDILRDFKIDAKTLPKNTTSYLQPLDLTVNGPFKSYYSNHWNDYQLNLDLKPLTKQGQNFKTDPVSIRRGKGDSLSSSGNSSLSLLLMYFSVINVIKFASILHLAIISL